MKIAKPNDLEPGAILAKNVYNSNNITLVKKDTVLDEKKLQRLIDLGVDVVYIKENDSQKAEPREKKQKSDSIPLVPKKMKKEAMNIAKSAFKRVNTVDNNDDFVVDEELLEIVDEIVETINNKEELMIKFQDINNLDNEIFSHLANVTAHSLIIAKSLDYSKERLKALGIGAFLHDIGKIQVPNEILNKRGELTAEEYKKVKKHTNYGYEILKNIDGIDDLSARVAYEHQERCDGTGYPKGIKKRFIHEFSRIVAVADVFDAMSNDRVYRDRITIKEVIEYLYIASSQNKLDHELIDKFLDYLAPYPIGANVKLNLGCEAVVKEVDANNKLRPIVELTDYEGLDGYELDLSNHHNITIEEVIKE